MKNKDKKIQKDRKKQEISKKEMKDRNEFILQFLIMKF